MNELEMESKNKHIGDLCNGLNEFKETTILVVT
jgi:hypothetical protein